MSMSNRLKETSLLLLKLLLITIFPRGSAILSTRRGVRRVVGASALEHILWH